MKVKRITIELEVENSDRLADLPHGSNIIFESGRWTIDGPLYSRFLPILHDIWKATRKIATGEE